MSGAFRLNFGKHRGKTLDRVPLLWLDWATRNLDAEEYPRTLKAIREYLAEQARREDLIAESHFACPRTGQKTRTPIGRGT